MRKKQVRGYDFHRQKPIDEFILDFFCHELMLGIEVDGFTHNWEETQKRDKIKEKKMKELGITILRFKDEEVMFEADDVMKKIEEYINRYEKTHPPSLPRYDPGNRNHSGTTSQEEA